jgi:hypothetical protein
MKFGYLPKEKKRKKKKMVFRVILNGPGVGYSDCIPVSKYGPN